jgi:hypothetical protein
MAWTWYASKKQWLFIYRQGECIDTEALDLEEYDVWLAEHLDELVAHYSAKGLAIYEGKVIVVGNTKADIYRRIREAGLEPMSLVFRVPCEEDLQSILKSDRRRLDINH